MMMVDLLVIGAGPAGMATAMMARSHDLDVMVIDEQPAPGGQIWRAVENGSDRDDILGAAYSEGRHVVEAFRDSGVHYQPETQLWKLEPGFSAFVSSGGKAEVIQAKSIVLATGAQERPVPFPGWTLPGVLTVGAAQILLKSATQFPKGPVWIAGSGPLPLLYAVQLLKAGGNLAGYLDTTPPGQLRLALRHLPRALLAIGDLLKGMAWLAKLSLSRTQIVRGVTELEAIGDGRVERLRYRTKRDLEATVPAAVLLVHEGVVPQLHTAMSVDCEMMWNAAQECFVPVVDSWGESSVPGLFIAGDGAGIAGAKAAILRGKLAGLRVAETLGRLGEADSRARPIRRQLSREMAARPFLDAMFRPRPQVFAPSDDTIVCRCEEVTAGRVRALAGIGRPGPNKVKAASRVGMGPCQGRQCGYTVTRIIAEAQSETPSEVGYFHIRPPLKPVTIGEVASLAEDAHRT
ncbi:FAD/NAD(P)-binding oxidoreductase [Devosia yakushimensis]|uniref:FAD/NAD(P)-binding oxidoreductase n=1 Tax=Devosia yakushimensis TaxID=470028 RepID=A0ABQ5UP36_9HYPH|nr:NAD(P)/FAD-dependent oxidoreductase [Devosia yakushimensis]GLQ12506.1 FAD/NAD(P)-binding oxidoreductase [Devosia yakushimensis]